MRPVLDSNPRCCDLKLANMSSSHDFCSSFSQNTHLRPLKSSAHRLHLPSLPSFSEFISFTFPKCNQHPRDVGREEAMVSPKSHSLSHTWIPRKDNPRTKAGTIVGISNRTIMREMEQTTGMESGNRISTNEIRACENSYISGEKLSRTARNASIRNATQLDDGRGSSLASKCSSRQETFLEGDAAGKDDEQRKRNVVSTTRVYDCPFCPLVLTYQKHLIAHVKEKHEQKKPFGCPRDGCWQRFGGLGDMNRHIKTVHDGEKRFSCDLCARCFSRRSGLKRHAYHVHGGDD